MARKPGKYEHVIASLPKLNGIGTDARENPKYQERVDDAKRAILAPIDQEKEDPVIDERLGRSAITEAESHLKNAHRYLLRMSAGKRHASTLVAGYMAARDLKDRIASWISNTNLLVEAYAQLMTDQMENEGITSLNLAGRPLSIHEEPWHKVLDPDALRAWVMRKDEAGNYVDPDLVKALSVNWQTMDGLVRRMLLAGEEPPPGIELSRKTRVRLGSE